MSSSPSAVRERVVLFKFFRAVAAELPLGGEGILFSSHTYVAGLALPPHTTEHAPGGGLSIAKKRACPLIDHAINSADGVALLEQYEREHGAKLTKKKQKFEDFMRSEYSVERLGKAPSHAVSLYTAPRVDAELALEGGTVTLSLKSFGYEAANKSKPKDWYAGFMVI